MTTYQVPREFAMGGSYVDETLFGESRAKKTAARRRAAARNGQSMVGQADSVLRISRSDYEAIKRRANAPLSSVNQHSPSQQTSRQRKQHRVEIKPLHKPKPTAAEEYERQYREQVGIGGANIRAFNMRNEELDEVKELQSHLEVMKVKAQIDKGVELKNRRREEIEAYERAKEREMELVRQRGLRQDAEKAAEARAAAKVAQQALLEQLDHRRQLQLLEEERLAQENLQMRRHLEKLAEADRKKKLEEKAAQARRNSELAKSNQLAEKYRVIAREQSEKEDRDIAAYLRKKAAAQEHRLRQAEKLKQEEELNVARMRALQEKHQDQRAEEDAKKAQAYQEARQLKEEEDLARRERERREMQAEVLRGLEQQKRLKAQRAYQQTETDAEYAQRIRAEAAEVNRRRDREVHQRREVREQYKTELQSLIQQREADRREAERLQREADQRNALEGEIYKHRVNLVIQQKLQDHAAHNYPLPAKYAPETAAKDEHRKKAAQKFHKTRALW